MPCRLGLRMIGQISIKYAYREKLVIHIHNETPTEYRFLYMPGGCFSGHVNERRLVSWVVLHT